MMRARKGSVRGGQPGCTATFLLQPGTYTGSFSTADTNGAILSVNQAVPVVVQPGVANTLTVALGGVPASFSIQPAAGQPFVLGSAASGYRLAGLAPMTLLALALDADGSPIIGAGSPTLTVSATGAAPVTVTQPTASAPNSFSITPTSYAAGGFTLTVTATPPTDVVGVNCSNCVGTLPVGLDQLLAVVNYNATDLYDIAPSGAPALTPIITLPGNASPSVVAFDAQRHHVRCRHDRERYRERVYAAVCRGAASDHRWNIGAHRSSRRRERQPVRPKLWSERAAAVRHRVPATVQPIRR